MNKVCPEGKVINPKTGRCIKAENLAKALKEKVPKQPKQEKVPKQPKQAKEPKKPKEPKQVKKAQGFNQGFAINQAIVNNLKILVEYETIHKEPYKVKAYEKVIDAIELYDRPIQTIEDIKNIQGVGKKIEDKIHEYLTTGKMHAVENAQQDSKYIFGKQLFSIYGIGPAKIDELMGKISSIEELKNKPELLNDKQKIGLKYYDDLRLRIPMAEGKKHYTLINKTLKKFNKEIEFEMVGSFRRKNKDMGDIDILIKNTSGIDLQNIIASLQESGYIQETLASGKNKFMGICRLSPDLPARRIDILLADPSYYYFALLYFTGSYAFNIYMRRIALQKGLSLSEYGFKNNTTKLLINTEDVIHSEEDIFKYLDISYVQPNKR